MPLRTLIIDGDSLAYEPLAEVIRLRNHTVERCDNIQCGLKRCEEHPFDLIIVDIGLPHLDGLDFCRQYRRLPDGARGLILIVSSDPDLSLLRRALEAGANDYLTKPVSLELFEARMMIFERRAHERHERLETVAALRQSEAKYRDLYENANDILFSIDMEGKLVSFNDALARCTGYSRDELRHMRLADILPPPSREKIDRTLERLFQLNFPTIFEINFAKRDGATFPIELNALLIFEEGQPTFLRGAGRDISDRREAERALRASEESFRTIFNSVHDAILLFDEHGAIVDVNDKMLTLYGVDRTQALKLSFSHDLSGPETSHQELIRYWGQALAGNSLVFHWQARRPWNGSLFDAEIVFARIELDRRPIILGTVRDITSRKQAERILHEALDKLNLHVENSPLAVIEWDAHDRIIRWSRQAERVFGWKASQVIGRRHSDWSFVVPEDQKAFDAMLDRLQRGVDERSVAQVRNYDSNRSIVWCEWYNSVVFGDHGELLSVLSLVQDASARYEAMAALEEKQQELERANEMLAKLAAQDGLTGLANRRLFDIRLAEEWGAAVRDRDSLALIMIDIDYFKRFNDSLGHLAGDDCLRAVSERIQRCLHRPNDLVARYGGEEFAVLLPGVRLSGGVHVAERIRDEIEALDIAHPNSDAAGVVTISAGVAAMTPTHSQHSSDLIAAADQALYLAKSRGRNQVATAEN